MVFKIICVGSIPAILEIFFYSSLKKPNINRKHKNYNKNSLQKLIRISNNTLIKSSEKTFSQANLKTFFAKSQVNVAYNLRTSYLTYLLLQQVSQINKTLTLNINLATTNAKCFIHVIPYVSTLNLGADTKLLTDKDNLLSSRKFFEIDHNRAYNDTNIIILRSWTLLKFIRRNLKMFNKKKLLGLYPTSQSYFLGNKNYFLSLDNVISFNNILTKSQLVRNSYSQTITKPFLQSFFLFDVKSRNTKVNRIKKLFYNIIKFNPSVHQTNSAHFSNKKRFVYLLFRFYNKKSMQKLLPQLPSVAKRVTINLFRDKERTKRFFKIFKKNIDYLNPIEHIYNRFHHTTSVIVKRKEIKSTSLTSSNGVYKTLFFSKNLTIPLVFFKKLNLMFSLFNQKIALKINYFFNYTSLLSKLLGTKHNNLIPDLNNFRFKSVKLLYSSKLNYFFRENITSWVYNTLVKFMESHSGKKVLVQVYSFMSQSINTNYLIFYKTWLPRFSYYERRLGHRFFLEEAFHILHMSFNYQDSKILSSWLKAIIQRISFWKTRFIFRFLRYLFNNYFQFIFKEIGVKGFKVKLKGKISVAGNSRKRSILYRVGKTSHSSCNLKVVHKSDTIVTFTGVMGFQVWIFY